MDSDEERYMNELKISRAVPKLPPGRSVDDLSSQEQREYLANLRDFSFYIERQILKDSEIDNNASLTESCTGEDGANNKELGKVEKITLTM